MYIFIIFDLYRYINDLIGVQSNFSVQWFPSLSLACD